MNLLVRSLSGNPSSGSSESPSSPTAPPRTGTRNKRSSGTSHHSRHPPLFSSHSSPGDLSPTSSRLPRRTATSWNDATRMVYDLDADPTWTQARRSGGFDEYAPESAPPSTADVRDFDYFEYFRNYGRGLGTPPSLSPSEEFHYRPTRATHEGFSPPQPSYSSPFRSSRTADDDHRTLNNGFRRLWRRSSREAPSFRVTPPSVPLSSVQVPMNNPRHRHSLIIENEEEEPDETILASSLPPSALSQHFSYDHHPSSSSSSFSPSHHQGLKKRNSSFSSPATTHHHNPSPIFPRKLSASNLPPVPSLHRPSVMFHPSTSSSAAFEDSRRFYYDANDGTNDPMSDREAIRHPHPRSGSLYDQRESSRLEIDAQNRRASSAVTSEGPSSRSLGAVLGQTRTPNITDAGGGGGGSTQWNPFRISFIETSAYTPQDIPDTSNSPDSEYIPFPSIQSQTSLHSKFQKQLHGEW